MEIILFATVKMWKFDKKQNSYQKAKVEWMEEPLVAAGMVAQAFDANIGAPVTVYFMFEDKKTGHRPESGNINFLPVIEQLNEVGIFVFAVAPYGE